MYIIMFFLIGEVIKIEPGALKGLVHYRARLFTISQYKAILKQDNHFQTDCIGIRKEETEIKQ